MSVWGAKDFALEAAIGVEGYDTENKYGEAPDCDSAVLTDVWDGADGSGTPDIWVPPTVARIHSIVSTSIADATGLTGMLTCQVWGLQTWSSPISSEVVVMNGTGGVNTVNSYVIIFRMRGITFGSADTNVGVITAVAATDLTTTAKIQAGQANTLMAIYGVPDSQDFYMTYALAGALTGSGSNVKVDGALWANYSPDVDLNWWVVAERFKFTQADSWDHEYKPRKKFTGPCMIKIQVVANANNTPVTGGFDGYLRNK